MNNTLRKIFTSALVVMTILGVSGLVNTNQAKAAAMDGDLIKIEGLSTVYYYKGGKRFVFPNEKTFMTWYRDFNNVRVISQSELESYPLGGNVTYRPGVKMVKITTDPKVYVVNYGRTLRSIVSEQNAINLFGPNWNKMIQDVPDAFFTNYVVGAPMTEGKYGEGQLLKLAGSPNVVYWDGVNYRPFTNESSFNANRFSFADVVTAPSSWTSFSPMGSAISGMESNLVDTSGSASSSTSTGTGLSVALASDTPASTSVPKGSSRVTYTKFNVTASNDGDINLQSVSVMRSGVGTPADFDNVYLYDGNTRLTTGRSINSSSNTATFNNLNMMIAKGTTKTLSIVADMKGTGSTGSGSSSLGIASASAVTAGGATVTGSFPVMGNMMSLTNVAAGKITIDGLTGMSEPRAGDMQAKVSSFRVDADSVEDQKITGITLYNAGTVQSDKLTNFTLKQAGTTVATAASMAGNGLIVLNFTTPFMLERGASRTFDLYADVAGTTLNDQTIDIYLDNSADLFSVGQTYGFGVSVDRSAFDEAGDAQTLTVEAAQVTFSFQGPAVTDIAVQQQDVEMFRFTVTAQSNIEIRNTRLQITAGGTGKVGLINSGAAMYKDIKFVDVSSNNIVAGPKDVDTTGDDTTQALVFTDPWTLNAGQTRTIKVTADVANFTPVSDETVRLTLNTFTSGDIRNLDNNQNVTDIVPSGAISGNTHRIKAGSLTTALGANPSAQTYVNGSTGVAMTGLNLTAGTGKDVRVTSIKLTAVGANSCATETDCVLNVKLWDGATQIGQTKSLSADTVTFDNLNYMIAKGTTKTLTVSADLNTLSTVAGSTTLRFNVAANGDIVAQDSDGNTVDNTGTVTGPNHTITSAGTLSVTLGADDSETEARVILTGKTDEVLAKYRFTAVNEPLKLTRVTIELPANTADEVNSLSLWDGATKVTGDVAVTNAATPYATFNTFTTDFVIAKDANKVLTVKANTNTISGGADSGATLTATLATDTTNDNQFEARGVSSNTVLDDDDMTQTAGRDMVLHKTKLTLTENAPACAGTLQNGCLISGIEQEVYKFTVAADANEDASLKQLIFNVVQTDNTATDDTLTIGSFKLYRGNTDITSLVDIHNLAGATIESTNTLAEGTAQAIVTWSSEEIIAKGTSNVYTLRATPGGYTTTADNDSLRVVLNSDATAQTAGYNYLVDLDTTAAQQTASLGDLANDNRLGTEGATPTLAANANIIWSDNAAVPHASTLVDSSATGTDSTSSGDWWNAYLLKNLPFSGYTVTN